MLCSFRTESNQKNRNLSINTDTKSNSCGPKPCSPRTLFSQLRSPKSICDVDHNAHAPAETRKPSLAASPAPKAPSVSSSTQRRFLSRSNDRKYRYISDKELKLWEPLLQEQREAFGEDMLKALTNEDEEEIEALRGYGYTFAEAACVIFNQRHRLLIFAPGDVYCLLDTAVATTPIAPPCPSQLPPPQSSPTSSPSPVSSAAAMQELHQCQSPQSHMHVQFPAPPTCHYFAKERARRRAATLSMLSEDEQYSLIVLLSTQEAQHHTNMFDCLTDMDESIIVSLLAQGYHYCDIVRYLFQQRFDPAHPFVLIHPYYVAHKSSVGHTIPSAIQRSPISRQSHESRPHFPKQPLNTYASASSVVTAPTISIWSPAMPTNHSPNSSPQHSKHKQSKRQQTKHQTLSSNGYCSSSSSVATSCDASSSSSISSSANASHDTTLIPQQSSRSTANDLHLEDDEYFVGVRRPLSFQQHEAQQSPKQRHYSCSSVDTAVEPYEENDNNHEGIFQQHAVAPQNTFDFVYGTLSDDDGDDDDALSMLPVFQPRLRRDPAAKTVSQRAMEDYQKSVGVKVTVSVVKGDGASAEGPHSNQSDAKEKTVTMWVNPLATRRGSAIARRSSLRVNSTLSPASAVSSAASSSKSSVISTNTAASVVITTSAQSLQPVPSPSSSSCSISSSPSSANQSSRLSPRHINKPSPRSTTALQRHMNAASSTSPTHSGSSTSTKKTDSVFDFRNAPSVST